MKQNRHSVTYYLPMKSMLFIVMVLLCIPGYTQKQGQKLIDKQLKQLRKMKDDTAKVRLLNVLTTNYATINTNEGIRTGMQGLALAEKLGWKTGIAELNNSLGLNYMSKADYKMAVEYFNNALNTDQSAGNRKGVAERLRNIGQVFVAQGNYSSALAQYNAAMKIDEDLEDVEHIATDLGNIGAVYQSQSNYALAIEYLLKALKINEERGNKAGIAANLSTIGIVYISEGNFNLALEKFNRSLKLYEAMGNKTGIAKDLKNIGNVFFSIHKYQDALEHYHRAMKIHIELGDKSGIARNLGNIGNVYQDQYNYTLALNYLHQARQQNAELGEKYPMANNLGSIGAIYLNIAKGDSLTLKNDSLILHGKPGIADKKACLTKAVFYLSQATSIDREIGNLNELQHFCRLLSEAYELQGNYKAAYENYQESATVRDSVFSVENNMKISAMEQNRTAELNEKQIDMQRLKIAAAKNENRYYFTGVAILVIVCGGLMMRFRTSRKTKEQLEEKNTLIAHEKETADMLRIRAEKSEQFKQQFLTNMSHEIRTPMNAVNGMTELLLARNPRPDQAGYLQVISRSSEILLQIINDILDLSRIESGKLELESIDFSLTEVTKEVKEALTFSADKKKLQLLFNIEDSIPDVLAGDPFRLKQVLLNLMGNGIKFTEKGSVQLSITSVAHTDQEQSLLFEIKDTGIGIAPDKFNSIFESFRQVQNSGSRLYGGTGLGLSISRQLIALHGSSIDVTSKPGEGSVFSFLITYATGSASGLLQQKKADRTTDGSILNGLRILLADDNEYNRMVAAETIRSHADVVIDEAVNGQEAIDLLAGSSYDIILMDIQMPVMDGMDATRHIRAYMPAPKNKIPIIALTASLMQGDVSLCTAAGMDSFLPKPFKAWQLISLIATLTGRK